MVYDGLCTHMAQHPSRKDHHPDGPGLGRDVFQREIVGHRQGRWRYLVPVLRICGPQRPHKRNEVVELYAVELSLRVGTERRYREVRPALDDSKPTLVH